MKERITGENTEPIVNYLDSAVNSIALYEYTIAQRISSNAYELCH